MSQKLLSEFPQVYINVLNLFNKKSASFYSLTVNEFNNNSLNKHFIKPKNSQSNSENFAEYFNQNSLMVKYPKTKEILMKLCNYDSEKFQSIFSSKKLIEVEINLLNNQALINIFKYEEKVNKYLKSLKNIDLTKLLVRDLELEPKFKKLFSEKEDAIKGDFKIKKENLSTIIASPLLISDNLYLFDEDVLSIVFSRMIIPEIEIPYYNEIILDELEEIIIDELEETKTIRELLLSLEKYFDKEDLEGSKIEFNKLIYNKLKMLLYQKGITICTK